VMVVAPRWAKRAESVEASARPSTSKGVAG
jgi:hypothetical protein